MSQSGQQSLQEAPETAFHRPLALPETQYAVPRPDGFAGIHADLLELLDDDADDEEQIKPTEYAFNRALRLLLDTQGLRPQSFPAPR